MSLNENTCLRKDPGKDSKKDQRMKVLIADDDLLSARALETDLRANGYDVTVVGDGAEAWQILKADDRPQIAILDWRMPIMDGLEVCRRVRQATGPYIYILLVTGNADPDSVITGMDAGAGVLVTKYICFHSSPILRGSESLICGSVVPEES